MLGYVLTGNGSRSRSAVDADIGRRRGFYGVDSVFVDNASARAADLGTYRRYADSAHAARGIAVLNSGVVLAQGYFAIADAVGRRFPV